MNNVCLCTGNYAKNPFYLKFSDISLYDCTRSSISRLFVGIFIEVKLPFPTPDIYFVKIEIGFKTVKVLTRDGWSDFEL